MAAALPLTGDVVIRRESPGTFTIGGSAAMPPIACRTLDEALRRVSSAAAAGRVRMWYSAGGSRKPLPDPELLRKVWREFVEMPGLRLTLEQAQRLWTVDADTCAPLLESLVDLELLARTADGKYARPADAGRIAAVRLARATGRAARPAAARSGLR